MKKWIKKSNNDPWETRKDDLTGTEPKSNWKRVFGAMLLCAMVLVAGWAGWTAMNGGFAGDLPETPEIDIVEDKAHDNPTVDDKATTHQINPYDDPVYHGNAMVGGGRNIEDGPGLPNFPDEIPVSVYTLESYGEAPTLEMLQKAHVPYVYAEDGTEIALFKVTSIVTNKDDVDFDSIRLTDGCVDSYDPIEGVELPETVYFDANQNAKFVEYQGRLHLVVTADGSLAAIRDQIRSWSVFGVNFGKTNVGIGDVEGAADSASDDNNVSD